MLEINDEVVEETPYIGIGFDGFCFSAIFMPESFDFQDDNEESTFGLMFFDGFESINEIEEFKKTINNVEVNQINRRHDVLVFKDLFSLENIINQLTFLRDAVIKKLEEDLSNA